MNLMPLYILAGIFAVMAAVVYFRKGV